MQDIEVQGIIEVYNIDRVTKEKVLVSSFHNQLLHGGRRELPKLIIPSSFGANGKSISHCQLGIGGVGGAYSDEETELINGLPTLGRGIITPSGGDVYIDDDGFSLVLTFHFNADDTLYSYLDGIGNPDINEIALLIDYPNREVSPYLGRVFAAIDFNKLGYPFKILDLTTTVINYKILFIRPGVFSSSSFSSLSSESLVSASSTSSFSNSSNSSSSSNSVSSESESSLSLSSQSLSSESSNSVSSDSSISSESSFSQSSLSNSSSSQSNSSSSQSNSSSSQSASSLSSASSESSESSTPWEHTARIDPLVFGTVTGDLIDIGEKDGKELVVNVAIENPCFDGILYYYKVPNILLKYVFWVYYGGPSSGDSEVYIYNFDTTIYELLGTLPYSATLILAELTLPSPLDDYLDNGEVRFRHLNPYQGTPTKVLHADQIVLESLSSTSSESSESSVSSGSLSSTSSESSESSVSSGSLSSTSSESSESSVSSGSLSSISSDSSSKPWQTIQELELEEGVILDGKVLYLDAANGKELELSEVSGVAPGFIYNFDFSKLPSFPKILSIRGFYEGNPAHIVKAKIYNYNTVSWEDLTGASEDFPSVGSPQDYIFGLPFPETDYVDSGILRVQIVHLSVGNGSHGLFFDKFILESSQSSESSVSSESITV